MEQQSRRVVAGVVRLVLVVLAMGIVAFWIYRRLPNGKPNNMRLQREAPAPEQLGPGDLRVFNTDSSLDLILQGDHILTGLSPKMVAQIRTQMDTEKVKDSAGLGGSIASLVKSAIGGAIGTHLQVPLSDLKDIRYENGRLVFEWNKGMEHSIFGNGKVEVNGKRQDNSFRPADAQAFIDAVHARKKELGQ